MAALDSLSRTPVTEGDPLAAWTTGGVLEVRGDVTIVRANGDIPARVAVFRYRGAEPLPRFLEHLKADGDRWRTLRHPNLMPTLETGRLPSQITCYWAQEEVPGASLAERLQVHPLVAPDHALAIARQIGAALTVVHRAELAHGDLGPHNVFLVDAKDRPRVAWGGLAIRLEAAGMDAGRSGPRLAEVAPELLAGKVAGPAADVYGVCALLYRMLAGQPAWNVRRGGAQPGVTSTDPLPSLPEWVGADVVRLLAEGLQRDPGRRPDLAELVDRIEDQENALRGQPVPLGTWSPAEAPSAEGALTPPTVSRTVAPGTQDVDFLDPTLANTPPSVSRSELPAPPSLAAPPLPPGVRSVAPSPAPPLERSASGTRPARHAPPGRAGSGTSPLLIPAAILTAAVVLGLFLLIGLYWFRPTGPGEPAAAPPVPAPATAAGGEIVAPPPAVGPAILTLVTDPAGAEVWSDGAFVGMTPQELVFDPAKGARDRVFELRLAGFEVHTIRQPFSEVDVRHSVTLRPAPKAAPKAAPSPAPATGVGPKARPKPPPDLGIKVER